MPSTAQDACPSTVKLRLHPAGSPLIMRQAGRGQRWAGGDGDRWSPETPCPPSAEAQEASDKFNWHRRRTRVRDLLEGEVNHGTSRPSSKSCSGKPLHKAWICRFSISVAELAWVCTCRLLRTVRPHRPGLRPVCAAIRNVTWNRLQYPEAGGRSPEVFALLSWSPREEQPRRPLKMKSRKAKPAASTAGSKPARSVCTRIRSCLSTASRHRRAPSRQCYHYASSPRPAGCSSSSAWALGYRIHLPPVFHEARACTATAPGAACGTQSRR